MTLSLSLTWQRPVAIREGRRDERLFWVCDDLASLPDEAGAYVFARKYGASHVPLYIGQALNIRARVFGHLKSNVPLMKAIGHLKNGRKVVLPCVITMRKGQRLARALDVLEDTLIRQAMLAGHEIFNKRGTRRPTHSLAFDGARAGTGMFGRKLKAEARKG